MDQSITLKIAGNTYSLKASSPEMEQMMRMAAADVNSMLSKFESRFPDKTMVDKLSFVALQQAIGKLSGLKKLETLSDEVNSLNADVVSYLDSLNKE